MQASTALPPSSLERPPSNQTEAVAQRAASASLSSTTSWPRAIGHGPEIRPALLQAFSSAGQGPVPGSGQVMGPDGMPSMPTAAQRLAQLQRSIAARGGSMPSPTNSWGRTVSQVHYKPFAVFIRLGTLQCMQRHTVPRSTTPT